MSCKFDILHICTKTSRPSCSYVPKLWTKSLRSSRLRFLHFGIVVHNRRPIDRQRWGTILWGGELTKSWDSSGAVVGEISLQSTTRYQTIIERCKSPQMGWRQCVVISPSEWERLVLWTWLYRRARECTCWTIRSNRTPHRGCCVRCRDKNAKSQKRSDDKRKIRNQETS